MERTLVRGVVTPAVVGLVAAAMVVLAPSATVAAVTDGMPSQLFTDAAATSGSNGNWGDMAGGVASRPYVSSMSLINSGTTTSLITGGTTAAPTVSAGDVTAVISPINLCRAGTVPSPDTCYATPNRVGGTVTYRTASSGNDGTDFAAPSTTLNQTLNAATVIDMTIALNTLGSSLRWTWANGDLLYWQTSNFGTPTASVHIKFKPTVTPAIDWSTTSSGGCTATPIRDCDIARADASMLQANLVLSLDETLDPALTGAVFATQGAIAGFLVPGGSATAPTLDLQVASSHLAANGSPQLGALKALIPAQTLINLYGVLPADASTFFTTARAGSVGTNSAPTFTPWTAATEGSDGVLVDVRDITFSAPTYKVSRTGASLSSNATVKGSKTTVTITKAIGKCKKKTKCSVTVYRLGSKYAASATPVKVGKVDKNGKASLKVNKSALKKGDRFLIAAHYKSGKNKGTLVQSGTGKVK